MLEGEKLLKYVSLLIDLLDRKATYQSIIKEKNLQLKNLGIENKMEMPSYPKIEYSFSFRKFFFKFILFAILFALIMIFFEEKLPYYMEKWIELISWVGEIIIIFTLVVKEITKKRNAKKLADTIYYDAVNTTLEHNRLDDLRVWNENEQAIQIKKEIEQWENKRDFVIQTIIKACRYGDLSQEYCEIEVLTVFVEYLRDNRCDTIYECMLKYDEAKRMKEISNNIDALENQIDSFEEAFSEASRRVSLYLRKRKENIENLCRYQANMLDDIEYNQETTNQSLMLLSLFD